jgi:hypothetical protein
MKMTSVHFIETSKFSVTVTQLHISEEVGQLRYTKATTSELANFSIAVALKQTQQLYFEDDFRVVMSEHVNHLTPNGHFSGRIAPLTYRCCIFYLFNK